MGKYFDKQIICSNALVVRCIGPRGVYERKLESQLDASTKELEWTKNELMRKIDIEERQGRKRQDQIRRWLLVVDIMIDKITKLKNKRQHQKAKSRIGGCCSTNYVSRNKYNKKVVRRLSEVKDLIEQVKEFKEVTKVILPRPMVEIPCELTVGLEQKFDTVCRYLLKEDVGIVGLYGERGVGKTALLTQVNNRICSETSRFDLVIWVTVTNPFMLGSIQNHIGKKIGFYGEEWMSKSLSEKAIDILDVLNKKKFVLLLDDISESINLVAIGVPLNNGMSKVVFTTTSERMCAKMEAHRIVRVEPLGWKDSWRLFCQKIGEDTVNSNPDIYNLANELVRECGGRPSIIIQWARKMACNRITQDWNDAVQHLRSPMLDSEGDKDSKLAPEIAELTVDASQKSCWLISNCFSPKNYNYL